jgi:hypothetical protein
MRVLLATDLGDLGDPTTVVAHELGHTLFAQHAYAGSPISDVGSVMGAGYGPLAQRATVNATDRTQVLGNMDLIRRVYCPSFVPGAPAHDVLPERQIEITHDVVVGWFAAGVTDPASFKAVAAGASQAVVSRRADGDVVALVSGSALPTRSASPRSIARLVSDACGAADAEVSCLPSGYRASAVLVDQVTRVVDNPAWVAEGLPG